MQRNSRLGVNRLNRFRPNEPGFRGGIAPRVSVVGTTYQSSGLGGTTYQSSGLGGTTYQGSGLGATTYVGSGLGGTTYVGGDNLGGDNLGGTTYEPYRGT